MATFQIMLLMLMAFAAATLAQNAAETIVNPGLEVRTSQAGLNYGAAVAVDILADKVVHLKLPDQSGTAKVPVVKNVRYDITNIQVTNFIKPAADVVVQPASGLRWSLLNAGIFIRGNWHLKYRIIVPIKDHGWFEASVSRVTLTISLTLGASASGTPTISSTACSTSISQLKIKLHGGASWLYNLFMKNVEKNLRNQLQTLICQKAREVIDVNAAKELSTIKTRVPVGSVLILDYGLVSSPSFMAGFFETFHRGEFYFVGDTSEAPFQPLPLPATTASSRMISFWISDYVMNTAGYVLHKHDLLKLYISQKDLPAANKTLLDLTCCMTCQCIGKLLPSAGKLFPNASAEVQLETSQPPVARIQPRGIEITFNGTTTLRARLTNGSLVYMVKLRVVVDSVVILSFNGTAISFKIQSMTANVSVIDSAIGDVSVFLLNTLVNILLKLKVIPELNKAGAHGIPMPIIKHVQLINTGVELQQNAICVSTDVKYVGEMMADDEATMKQKWLTMADDEAEMIADDEAHHQSSALYFEPSDNSEIDIVKQSL